jgi:hypothetical protein
MYTGVARIAQVIIIFQKPRFLVSRFQKNVSVSRNWIVLFEPPVFRKRTIEIISRYGALSCDRILDILLPVKKKDITSGFFISPVRSYPNYYNPV